MAEITTSHEFYYNTTAPITAKALADTLLGLDGIVRRSAPVIARLLPNVGTVTTEILITEIRLESYKENFIVRMVFGDGEDAEEKIEAVREKLRLKNMNATTIVGVAILGSILVGGGYYLHSAAPAADTIHIENSFNTLGGQVGMNGKDYRELVEAVLDGHKEDVKKQIVRLVHPDGSSGGGTITIDGNAGASVPPELIQSVPNKYEPAEKENPFRTFDNVQITVRATDLDRLAQGWAAVVPSIDNKRYPLEVSADLDPSKIPSGQFFYGDLIVIYNVDKKGAKTPKKYQLTKFHGLKPAISSLPTAVPSASPASPALPSPNPNPGSP